MGLFAAMGKTRRRLGVLGGTGPAATALFYRELVALTPTPNATRTTSTPSS